MLWPALVLCCYSSYAAAPQVPAQKEKDNQRVRRTEEVRSLARRRQLALPLRALPLRGVLGRLTSDGAHVTTLGCIRFERQRGWGREREKGVGRGRGGGRESFVCGLEIGTI